MRRWRNRPSQQGGITIESNRGTSWWRRLRVAAPALVMGLVVAACSGGGRVDTTVASAAPSTTDAAATSSTTTTAPPPTLGTTVVATTTISPDVNLATAEALVTAMFDADVEGLESLPWFNARGVAKQDAMAVALFGEAVNVEVLERSCEEDDVRLVTCRVEARDDLLVALGGVIALELFSIDFDQSGAITGLVRETHDGGLFETFGDWAWNIAYPNICESPAQCALALLAVVEEYNETYPGAVIASYIAAYNAADIDRVMELFTDESAMAGHPFDSSVTGLTEIRAIQIADIDAAAPLNAYTISNLDVDGDTVTWDHRWVGDDGNEFCISGHVAVIRDGRIASWTWPRVGFDCP